MSTRDDGRSLDLSVPDTAIPAAPIADTSIPDVVLDELRNAFSGGSVADPSTRAGGRQPSVFGDDDLLSELTGVLDGDRSVTDAPASTRGRSAALSSSDVTRVSARGRGVAEDRDEDDGGKADNVTRERRRARKRRLAAERDTAKAASRAASRAAASAAREPVAPSTAATARKVSRKERRAAAKAKAAPPLDDGVESVRVLPAAPRATDGSPGAAMPPVTSMSPTSPMSSSDADALLAQVEDPAAPAAAPAPPAPADTPSAPRSTIVIGGDDLPDAVYLDEDAEPRLKELYGGETDGGSGAIVLGNELDSSGAFDAVSPPSRSMDPRVRARRIAVKRAASRKRLIWAGAVVVVMLLIVGALAVFSSSLFAVRAQDVEVTGAVYTDPTALDEIIQTVVGEPVLLVDTQALEDRLEGLPWVERAAVSTDFPHSLEIDLRERLPIATFVGADGRYRVIDREGRVLAVLDNQPVSYMLLTGAAPDTEAGAFAGEPFAAAAQLVTALPADIREITTSIDVDATTGDLGLLLQPEIPVRLGGFAAIETKLARLLQYMRGDDGLSDCVAVDVSTGEVSCATR